MSNNLNLFLINTENSIKESMIKIKKNGTRTLLVVKKNNTFRYYFGGDIHTALIKNYNLNSSIEKIFNKNPKKVTSGNYNLNKISKMFLNTQIGIIPVVDSKNLVKKIISWEDVFGSKRNSSELKKLK